MLKNIRLQLIFVDNFNLHFFFHLSIRNYRFCLYNNNYNNNNKKMNQIIIPTFKVGFLFAFCIWVETSTLMNAQCINYRLHIEANFE